MSSGKLGEVLVAQGVITQDQLRAALDHRNKSKGRLSASLIQLGHVNENVLATFFSKQYGIPATSLDDVTVTPDLAKLVPLKLCEKHMLVPLSVEGNRLTVAISDPSNAAAVDDVRFLSNMDVVVYIASESAIRNLIDRAYNLKVPEAPLSNEAAEQVAIESLEAIIDPKQLEDGDGGTGLIVVGKSKDNYEIEEERVGEKPVIRLINKLFVEAIRRKASDIHVEPFEQFSKVRFRIDGALHEVMRLPPQLKTATPARIKVMANMDISEKRLPQDGRLQVRTKNKKIDVRVSVLPTIFGEKVCMRLLTPNSSNSDLSGCGFEEEQLNLFRKAVGQPYGMILVTGPTGSGKSTTLYAALAELNTPDVNISTVEDPVEYNMAGVNQVPIKDSIGMNFAAALRSLLRQDPDVVMVGEIRDTETAEIAIKAALTGHLVLSTLHTNDAPSTISRLLHMGIEPFLITASLTMVEAQRLIRVNCEACAAPDTRVTREALLEAEVPEHWLETIQPMRGVGCQVCNGTGFKGRRGIFEVMYLTERMREQIIKGANADQLRKTAIEDGLITLRQCGLLKLYRGETTLEEVLNSSRPDGDIKKS